MVPSSISIGASILKVFESELSDEAEWITECMARLFIHSQLFQCSRFYGDGLAALDKCPGRQPDLRWGKNGGALMNVM